MSWILGAGCAILGLGLILALLWGSRRGADAAAARGQAEVVAAQDEKIKTLEKQLAEKWATERAHAEKEIDRATDPADLLDLARRMRADRPSTRPSPGPVVPRALVA